MSSQSIHLYLTSEHKCSYLPDRLATSLVPDPNYPMDMHLFSQLIALGYRRSGNFTYRPHCRDCNECQPCRIPVRQFTPRRNQRRCLKANRDLALDVVKAGYSDEHFELYRKYINSRHADGDMVNPEPKDFTNFLFSDWSNTHFIEARTRKQGRLLAVAVTDVTEAGLSAVYSYFDPEFPDRSLGTFCILQQIQRARLMQFDYLYMGYWIRQCKKMKYKADFQPLEVFNDNEWKTSDAPA